MQGEEAGQFGFEFEQFLSVSADGEGIVDPVFVDHEVIDGFERASFREKGFETMFVFLVGIRICFLFETRQKLLLFGDGFRNWVRLRQDSIVRSF